MNASKCRNMWHTAAQLVQLRKTEALGMLDHHQRCVGHVDTDLDDGGRNQHIDLAGGEERHRLRLVGRGHAAMQQADAALGQRGAQALVRGGRVLYGSPLAYARRSKSCSFKFKY